MQSTDAEAALKKLIMEAREAVREELFMKKMEQMTLPDLKRFAQENNIPQAAIDLAMQSTDAEAALKKLIMEAREAAEQKSLKAKDEELFMKKMEQMTLPDLKRF